jgi:arylformamidase
MEKEKVVELSHRIIAGKENFKMETRVDDVTNILPEVTHRPDVWYVLGEVTFCTHVGTHIEVPFHHLETGHDVADFPFQQLIGPLVVLDFSHKKDQEAITLEELNVHEDLIHEGDIVFIRSDMDKYFRTERWNEQPHLTEDANQWLIDKKIACLGSDAAGLEVPGTDYQPNHQAIFNAGIPMIESLTNLDKVENGKYIVFILPLALEGLEASPLRVIAIRKEDLHELAQG